MVVPEVCDAAHNFLPYGMTRVFVYLIRMRSWDSQYETCENPIEHGTNDKIVTQSLSDVAAEMRI